MTPKPKIQYVGQFYVYGSEARVPERKKEQRRSKTKLPEVRAKQVRKIAVEPVALGGILVAAALLAVMIVGVLGLYSDWEDYAQMRTYVSQLKQENAQLDQTFRESYDLEQVKIRAEAMGLIPMEEADTMPITVQIPEPQPQPSFWDDLIWFCKGLFA